MLSTHLTELIKANVSELISYAEVSKLIKDLPKEQGELVKDIVPSQITMSGIQRVLQLLLAERVSIRDLATILEGVADAITFSRNPAMLVEHVRARLARQICAQYTTAAGYLPLIALTAKWEQAFAESIVGQGDDKQPGDAAVAAHRIHHAGARTIRGGRTRRRGTRAGHLGGGAPFRARHRGTLPRPDRGDVAGRDPPAREAQDGREYLTRRVARTRSDHAARATCPPRYPRPSIRCWERSAASESA